MDSGKFSYLLTFCIQCLICSSVLKRSESIIYRMSDYFLRYLYRFQVTGTVDVTQGSKLVTSAQNLPLDPGERIRIGTSFETTVVADAHEDENDDSTSRFIIARPWTEGTAKGLKLWKKDYDRVVALAKGAYNATAIDAVKAESLFFLARVYHVRGETENAHKFYTKADRKSTRLNSSH